MKVFKNLHYIISWVLLNNDKSSKYLANKICKICIKSALILSVKFFEIRADPNDFEHTILIVDEADFERQGEVRRGGFNLGSIG